ncbi:MAG: hypothetical protein ACK5NF_06435 [Bacilli bacterium]
MKVNKEGVEALSEAIATDGALQWLLSMIEVAGYEIKDNETIFDLGEFGYYSITNEWLEEKCVESENNIELLNKITTNMHKEHITFNKEYVAQFLELYLRSYLEPDSSDIKQELRIARMRLQKESTEFSGHEVC